MLKKHFWKILCLFLFILVLNACSTEHEHTYNNDYTSNTDRHWRESFCGHGSIDDGEHTFDEGRIVTPSTCNSQGYSRLRCTVCGFEKEISLDLLEHSLEHFEAQAPTCTTMGWEAFDACKSCSYSTKSEYYDFSAHNWVATQYRTEPTCRYKGSQEYRCTYCTYTKSESLPTVDCNFVYAQTPFQHVMSCEYCSTQQGSYERHTLDTSNTCTACNYQLSCEGMTFALSEDESYYILTDGGDVQYRYTSDAGYLVVPPYHNGLPVKAIGERAMSRSYARGVGSIYIFDHIETIGRYAFYNTQMGRIYLPDTLKFIDEDAFASGQYISGTDASVAVYFGGTLEEWMALELATLYSNPMKGRGVGSLTLENGPSLSHLIIPEGTTEIKPFTFAGCRSIRKITLPKGLIRIGESAFDFSTPSVTFSTTYYLYRSAYRELVIPDSVETIGKYAFRGTSLLSVTLGRGLVSVGESAFATCRNLVELNNLSALSTNSLLSRAIYADSLLAIRTTMPQETHFYTNEQGFVFYEAEDGLYLVYLEDGGSASMEDLTLPDAYGAHETYAIHAYALYERNIKKLTIPDCVSRIGKRAFLSCPRLEQLTVGNGVTEIGDYAFYNCGTMANYPLELHVTLGSAVQTLGDYAFASCAYLTSFEMPDTVVSIGAYCFRFCSNLTTLRLSCALESIGKESFAHCTSLAGIIIPAGVTSLKNCFQNCKLQWLVLQGTPSEISVTADSNTEGTLQIYLSCESVPAAWGNNWNGGFPVHTAQEWQLENGAPAPR